MENSITTLFFFYFTQFIFVCLYRSVSFYPQVISNFKRKSTAGLSVDFCVLNVIGFACYTAYSASLYWSPTIQELYKERYGPDAEITVQSNDVAFAIHALVLSLLTLCQIVYYNSQNRTFSETEVSDPILVAVLGIVIICIGYPFLMMLTHILHIGNLNLLDYIYLLSYIKIFISLIKYMPQVVLNFRRKSTVGWSIWNILLDLTGGTLSDLQVGELVTVIACHDNVRFPHDFLVLIQNYELQLQNSWSSIAQTSTTSRELRITRPSWHWDPFPLSLTSYLSYNTTFCIPKLLQPMSNVSRSFHRPKRELPTIKTENRPKMPRNPLRSQLPFLCEPFLK